VLGQQRWVPAVPFQRWRRAPAGHGGLCWNPSVGGMVMPAAGAGVASGAGGASVGWPKQEWRRLRGAGRSGTQQQRGNGWKVHWGHGGGAMATGRSWSGPASGGGFGRAPAWGVFCAGLRQAPNWAPAWTVDKAVAANVVEVVSDKAHGNNFGAMKFATASGATFIHETMGFQPR